MRRSGSGWSGLQRLRRHRNRPTIAEAGGAKALGVKRGAGHRCSPSRGSLLASPPRGGGGGWDWPRCAPPSPPGYLSKFGGAGVRTQGPGPARTVGSGARTGRPVRQTEGDRRESRARWWQADNGGWKSDSEHWWPQKRLEGGWGGWSGGAEVGVGAEQKVGHTAWAPASVYG